MSMLKKYYDKYLPAEIYGIFVLLSLIVALILFTVVGSFAQVEQTWFKAGGAFGGFIITLITLITHYNKYIKDNKKIPIVLKGFIVDKNNTGIESALISWNNVVVYSSKTPGGYFEIQVDDKSQWELVISFQDTTINRVISRKKKDEDIKVKFDTVSVVETEKVTLKGFVKNQNNIGIANADISCNNVLIQSSSIPKGFFSLEVDDNPQWKLRVTIFKDTDKEQVAEQIVLKENRKKEIEIVFDTEKK